MVPLVPLLLLLFHSIQELPYRWCDSVILARYIFKIKIEWNHGLAFTQRLAANETNNNKS